MKVLFSIVGVCFLSVPVLAVSPTSKPLASEAKQITGAWQLQFTTPDGVKRTPIVLVGRQHKELVAWYLEKDKPETVRQVRLQGDSLHLTFRPKERGDVEVTFKARLVKEDACVGEVTYLSNDGDSGSWSFQGRRLTRSDFEVMQAWQLRFVTPDERQRAALVTIVEKDDKLYGWYQSEELDLPVLSIGKDGDQAAMLMTAKTPDGQDVEVTFRGTVDGKTVQGEADYDLEGVTGSFAFSGTRQS